MDPPQQNPLHEMIYRSIRTQIENRLFTSDSTKSIMLSLWKNSFVHLREDDQWNLSGVDRIIEIFSSGGHRYFVHTIICTIGSVLMNRRTFVPPIDLRPVFERTWISQKERDDSRVVQTLKISNVKEFWYYSENYRNDYYIISPSVARDLNLLRERAEEM